MDPKSIPSAPPYSEARFIPYSVKTDEVVYLADGSPVPGGPIAIATPLAEYVEEGAPPSLPFLLKEKQRIDAMPDSAEKERLKETNNKLIETCTAAVREQFKKIKSEIQTSASAKASQIAVSHTYLKIENGIVGYKEGKEGASSLQEIQNLVEEIFALDNIDKEVKVDILDSFETMVDQARSKTHRFIRYLLPFSQLFKPLLPWLENRIPSFKKVESHEKAQAVIAKLRQQAPHLWDLSLKELSLVTDEELKKADLSGPLTAAQVEALLNGASRGYVSSEEAKKRLQLLSGEQMNAILLRIDFRRLSDLSDAQLKALRPDVLSKLSTERLNALFTSCYSVHTWKTNFALLSSAQIQAILPKLPTNKLEHIPKDVFKHIDLASVPKIALQQLFGDLYDKEKASRFQSLSDQNKSIVREKLGWTK